MHSQNLVDFLWYLLMEAEWSGEDVVMSITIVWVLWTNGNDVLDGGKRKNG